MEEPKIWRTQGVNLGMLVYASDGTMIGSVKEVREHDFVVDRDNQRDIIVAVTMVTDFDADGNRLTLELDSAGVEQHDWEHPPLI